MPHLDELEDIMVDYGVNFLARNETKVNCDIDCESLKINESNLVEMIAVEEYNACQKSLEHLGHFFIIHICNHSDRI